MNVAQKTIRGSHESGMHPIVPGAPVAPGAGPTLERLRLEHGGRLDLDLVLRIADVLLFHMDHGHRRGVRFPHLHATTLRQLADGSLVLESSALSHAQAPEPEATSNEQTDVLKVGALLFYLLTGHEPHVTLHGPLPSLATLAPELPIHVVRALQRALHPRRAVRWLDVAELRDALFGDEAARRTLPIGFQRPDWALELMNRAHARRIG